MPTDPPLDPDQLAAYFALTEVGSLLHHAVEAQLREAGSLSYTQFQILGALADSPDGALRMTDIADRLVHSRSGLTYQVAQLTAAGLVTRAPATDDERATIVTATAQGRDALARALPGHIDVVKRLLLSPLSDHDVSALGEILGRVRRHMRTEPPRSLASRKRVAPPTPTAAQPPPPHPTS